MRKYRNLNLVSLQKRTTSNDPKAHGAYQKNRSFWAAFPIRRLFNSESIMTETQELLDSFVRHRSEQAFRELVARYFDLVYSTAVRLVDGDTHRAEDVAQVVFADLARMAGKLS